MSRKQGSTAEDESSVIFVERFSSPAEAGERWKNDVKKGRSVTYLSQKCYLGTTSQDSELDEFLSSSVKA